MTIEQIPHNKFFKQVINLTVVMHLNQKDPSRRVAWLANNYAKKWKSGREKRALKNISNNRGQSLQAVNALYMSVIDFLEKNEIEYKQ